MRLAWRLQIVEDRWRGYTGPSRAVSSTKRSAMGTPGLSDQEDEGQDDKKTGQVHPGNQ
jgi:hypothetical protein